MAPPPPPPLPPLAPDAAATPGWYYPLLLLLISCSALFSGLTLGLMSLDESQLQIIIAGDDRRQRMHAEKILPIRRRGNLLLCTLLLGNSLVNSMLAILVDGVSWLSGPMGVVASTTFILIFGEILPQSFCSRHGLAVGYYTSEVVKIAILALGLVAWPLSKLLDCSLGEELGTQYSRTELKHLFAMQAMQSQEAPGGRRAPHDATPGSSARLDTGLGASLSCATGASDEFGSVADGDVSVRPPHRGIRPAEVSWLCGVLSLSERTAEQIMTPLHDVFRVYDDDVLDFQLMRKIADSGHSRIPVLKRSADMIAPGQPRERTTAAHRPGAAAADGARGGVDAKVRQGEGHRKTQGGGNGGGNGGNGGGEGRQADISRSDSEQSSKAGAGSGTGQRVGAGACGSTPAAPSRAQSQSASRPDSPPPPGASASSHPDRLTVSEWPDTCRSTDVVGLLSAKDLILVDPENAVPLSQMLKYCAREVVTAWFDTPVAQLFRDFKSGRSHLAMIQRVNDGATAGAGEGGAASAVCDPFYEVVGIVSLEDVLEELLGAEIVDESDVYTDNVTRGAVEGRRDEVRRREAWQNMLDPAQASALDLSIAEMEVIALYLAAKVPMLSSLPPVHLHALLRDSQVEVLPGGDSAPPPVHVRRAVRRLHPGPARPAAHNRPMRLRVV